MDSLRTYPTQHTTSSGTVEESLCLVPEEILAIHVQGQPYAALARTPGDEEELIAGMCFSDGLIEVAQDFASLSFFPSGDRNQAQVWLSERRYQEVLPIIQDRKALRSALSPMGQREKHDINPTLDQVLHLADVLSQHQVVRARTFATHAAALFDQDLELLSIKEDLGRHNAFDKAIGDLLLQSRIHEARVVMLSSRVASELVVKALRLGLSMVVSVSRPTEGALALAKQGGLSLVCLSKSGGCYRFS